MSAHRIDDPADLLTLAVELAREAGTLALDGRRSAATSVAGAATKSTLTDLVTEYDRAAEQLVVDRLRRARPDDAIVGEEGASVSGSNGYSWLIDPIDGTTNFVYDLSPWCTSIAVEYDGETVAGAVFVPATNEMFAASAGGGATLDGRPLRCSDRDDLSLALVATGFAYDAKTRVAQAERVVRMIPRIRDVRRLGSAAVDLCHVAAGRVDAYFEEHLNAWDAAAGQLVAVEAGAVASNFAGGPPRPDELLVAAPGVHRELVELLAESA